MIQYTTRIVEDREGVRRHANYAETNEQGKPPRVYLQLIKDFHEKLSKILPPDARIEKLETTFIIG